MTETPWFEEIFDDHVAATKYLVEKTYELHFKGHTFRAVELKHESIFEGFSQPAANNERWRVFIRVFPL